MALHVDIPSRAQLERLLNHRSPFSISLYVTAGRLPDEGQAARIAVKSLGSQALDQVRAGGGDHRLLQELEGFLDDLDEHDAF